MTCIVLQGGSSEPYKPPLYTSEEDLVNNAF